MKQKTRHTFVHMPQFAVAAPLPPLPPYERCTCGTCPTCRSDAKWDAIFAKFEIKGEDKWPTKGMFQSTLRGW